MTKLFYLDIITHAIAIETDVFDKLTLTRFKTTQKRKLTKSEF